jgi:hypothetical protein
MLENLLGVEIDCIHVRWLLFEKMLDVVRLGY